MANLAVGALVFGQALGDEFSVPLAILGFGIWLFVAFISVAIIGRGDE